MFHGFDRTDRGAQPPRSPSTGNFSVLRGSGALASRGSCWGVWAPRYDSIDSIFLPPWTALAQPVCCHRQSLQQHPQPSQSPHQLIPAFQNLHEPQTIEKEHSMKLWDSLAALRDSQQPPRLLQLTHLKTEVRVHQIRRSPKVLARFHFAWRLWYAERPSINTIDVESVRYVRSIRSI